MPSEQSEQPTLLGRFRIQKVIGAGGMGVVYQVRSLEDGKKYALKTLLPGQHVLPNTFQRFVREAETLMRLEHPNIVRVFESGEMPEGTPYMLMELLRGRDLREELRIRLQLPVVEAVGYVLQITDALSRAHDAGIIHRDIKPQNMFITQLEGARCVKLLDFGISKLAGGIDVSLTASQDVLGTPSYMSPEQVIAAHKVDARTDIWSLGVVLYYLVTGQLPFAGASASAVIAAIPTAAPVAPSVLVPDLPLGFEAVVLRCLEKSPAGRYDSVAFLHAALSPFGPRPGASLRAPAIDVPSTMPAVQLARPAPPRLEVPRHPARLPGQEYAPPQVDPEMLVPTRAAQRRAQVPGVPAPAELAAEVPGIPGTASPSVPEARRRLGWAAWVGLGLSGVGLVGLVSYGLDIWGGGAGGAVSKAPEAFAAPSIASLPASAAPPPSATVSASASVEGRSSAERPPSENVRPPLPHGIKGKNPKGESLQAETPTPPNSAPAEVPRAPLVL